MTTTTLHSGVTRRQFMVGAAGLSFTILVDGCAALRPADRGGAGLAAAPADGSLKVNAWASLSTDGTIYIANPAVEMGQGSQTAIPLIIAEEMDADWSRVVIVPAAPDDKIYGNPGFRGLMYTAGSATVTGYWDVARTFGAQRSEEHTSELQSRLHLVCRLLLEKKKEKHSSSIHIHIA